MTCRTRFGNPEPVASHLVLLTRVFDLSSGPVLEIGTGYFSTLLLHWLATTYRREVVSLENSPGWYERAKKYCNDYHRVEFVASWAVADLEGRHWGMAFVDHSPGMKRPVEVKRLADHADYIVIHDTQMVATDGEFCFSTAFPAFKWRYDYTKTLPWTSVMSNFKDLSNVP